MAVLIGVDEAGYGPNYGPLVVAATAWEVEEKAAGGRRQGAGKIGGAMACTTEQVVASSAAALTATRFPDLYKLLRKAVVRSPDAAGRKLAIADSKVLYKAGFGVRRLERGVLAALAAMGAADDEAACVEQVAELLQLTAADPAERRRELDCHFDDEQRLPLEMEAAEICRQAAKLRQACAESGVRLLAVRARLVYPAEFNTLVEQYGTKGAALSHVTLGLVRRVVDEVGGAGTGGMNFPARLDSFLICLDKHGGRNRYAALVQHHFPESWIETLSEGRAASWYRWRHGEQGVEAIFRVGCEELLPTALASMTAKYHRELAMRAFNAFWAARLPALRPTAGYPGDSRRFKAEIAAAQRELGIEDEVLWRCR